MTNPTLHQIAATVRARRRALGLSQAGLAGQANVSRKWINEFEQGKSGVELGLVLRVFDALGLAFSVGGDRSPPTGGEAAPAELMVALEESLARARAGRPTQSGGDR